MTILAYRGYGACINWWERSEVILGGMAFVAAMVALYVFRPKPVEKE